VLERMVLKGVLGAVQRLKNAIKSDERKNLIKNIYKVNN